MKTYILQKDLPDGAKVGDEYELISDLYINKRLENITSPVIEHNSYFKWQVENNPEFFKLKEEEKPQIVCSRSDGNYIYFSCSYDRIPPQDFEFKVSKERLAEILIAESKGLVAIISENEAS